MKIIWNKTHKMHILVLQEAHQLGRVLCTFLQYLIAFFSRREAASDVISSRFVGLIVLDKRNLTRNCRRLHFRPFFRGNFQPEVVSAVISSVAVEYVGMDVRVKFGDSRSIVLEIYNDGLTL